MSCVYATSCVFACVHVAFEPFCSYKQQSPDFYQLATMAILCTESGKELVTWGVALTLKGQGEEKRVTSGLQEFGQACIMDKRFGGHQLCCGQGPKQHLFFHRD